MATLSDRIAERMADLGLSQEALGEMIGVSQVAVSKVISGKTKDPRNLYEYAKALRTTAEWLKEGKGEKELSNPLDKLPPHLRPGPAASVVAWHEPSDLPENTVWIPHYDVHASAGNGHAVEWAKRSSNDPLNFRAAFFAARKLRPENLRCLYVHGDSMEPALRDRDTVMIDITETTIRDGATYAVLYADELYIKRLYRIPGGGVEMRSYNPEYAPVLVTGADLTRFVILGREVYRSG